MIDGRGLPPTPHVHELGHASLPRYLLWAASALAGGAAWSFSADTVSTEPTPGPSCRPWTRSHWAQVGRQRPDEASPVIVASSVRGSCDVASPVRGGCAGMTRTGAGWYLRNCHGAAPVID